MYWVDILRKKIHAFEPGTGRDSTVGVPDVVSSVVPAKSGGVIATLRHGFYRINLDTHRTSLVATVKRDMRNRFNDGKCDSAGRYWAGTMNIAQDKPTGVLYCLETGSKIIMALSGVTVSNGLGWSPDDKMMYYIDSPTKEVKIFNYDLDAGKILNTLTVINLSGEEGVPDGMAVDAEGMIWVAQWGGATVSRWNPFSGKCLERVTIPARQTTSCCFGGTELEDLYVTTARGGLGKEELATHPHSGGLYRIRTGVRGLPTNQFGD